MTAVSFCPETEELQRYLLGEISTAELEGIERHLRQCDSCLARIPAIEAEDSLVAALRSQEQGAEAPPDIQVEAMIHRLEALRLVVPEDGTMATLASWAADQSSAQIVDGPRSLWEDATAQDGLEEVSGYLPPLQQGGERGRLGPYRLLSVLGAGGMGVVFAAEDPRLGRHVAVKILRPELASRAANRQRFLREARVAAALEHEHIVHINEVGEDRGVPYVAMPLLRGESLEVRLKREGKLPVAEVLRIGRELSEGLSAAHAHGLVHRDVKPANIWLEEWHGRVKVLDFGLARPVASEVHLTRTGLIVGSPAYMAPEQARGGAIDQRADLFSLGCVLYRMAIGQPPFRGATAIEIITALALEQPTPPAQLAPELPEALSELILALLHKDATERPTSAQEVIAALAALERGQGSGSRPLPETSTLTQQIRPRGSAPLRRHGVKLLTALATLGVVAGLAARMGWRSLKQEDPVVETSPEAAVPPARVKRFPQTARRLPLPLSLGGLGTKAYGVAFSPDGRLLLACGRETARVWDLATGKEGPALDGARAFFLSASFSPDGRQLACGTTDGRVKVWDSTNGQLVMEKLVPGEVHRLAHSPDGKYLAAPSVEYMNSWPFGSLNVFDTLTGGEPAHFIQRSRRRYTSVAYHPDGRHLAAGTGNVGSVPAETNAGTIEVWDVVDGKMVRTFSGFKAEVRDVSYSPDGKWLAAGSQDGTMRIWEAQTGQAMRTLKNQDVPLEAIAFSPDGSRLASGDEGGVVRVFSADTGSELLAFRRSPRKRITGVVFSPDGTLLASAGDDGLVKVWDANRPESPPIDSR